MAHQLSPNMTLIAAAPGGIAETSLGRTRNVSDTGTMEFTATEDDTLALVRLPAHAVLEEILWYSDVLGATILLDFGFWRAGQGAAVGAAIDANAIGTAVDCDGAAHDKTDLRYETQDINTAGQEVWELAGLSERPDYDIDFGIEVGTGTTPAAASISWLIRYHV